MHHHCRSGLTCAAARRDLEYFHSIGVGVDVLQSFDAQQELICVACFMDY